MSRLALATGQASDEVPYLKKMKEYLLALWKISHYSPARAAGLKLIKEAMSLPELKTLKGVDTRWLSHKASVSALLWACTRWLHDTAFSHLCYFLMMFLQQ